MHDRKDIDLGIIVLSPECDFGRLKTTFRSINKNYPKNNVVCITGKDATPTDMKETKTLCKQTWRGGATIASLINTGMKRGHKQWNLFVIEGATIKNGVDYKYASFIENELDVIFPIVTNYSRDGRPTTIYKNFENCTLNGLMIHYETFKAVGNIPDLPKLNRSKLLWAAMASEQKCKFKSILGVKIC